MSAPISVADDSNRTNPITYKLMIDKDSIHDTFRTIIQGGKIGPAFSASMSIVQTVEVGSSAQREEVSTPAVSVTLYTIFVVDIHTATTTTTGAAITTTTATLLFNI
jgi:hypothetical protein